QQIPRQRQGKTTVRLCDKRPPRRSALRKAARAPAARQNNLPRRESEARRLARERRRVQGRRLSDQWALPPYLFDRGQSFRLCESFFNHPDHVEGLQGDVVVLALNDFLKTFDSIGNLDVLAFSTSELLRHKERLRKEWLNLPRAGNCQLIVI